MSTNRATDYVRFNIRCPGLSTTISMQRGHFRVWQRQMSREDLCQLCNEVAVELIGAGDYRSSLSRAVRDRVDEILEYQRYAA